MAWTVIYDSNNSGGSWWLSTEQWEALEAAGWVVHWVDPDSRYGGRPTSSYKDPLAPCPRTPGADWLGAAACSAATKVADPADAIHEWEQVTGEDPAAIGCTCCGPPHAFDAVDEEGNRRSASARIVHTEIGFE